MKVLPGQLSLPLFELGPDEDTLSERHEEKSRLQPRPQVPPDRPVAAVLDADATDAGVSVVMTASEVAERIGFSPDWVLDRFEAGDVPGYRFGRKGGPVRFRWADWELFLRRCRVGPSVEIVQTHGA
ncbi:MAG: hypothetical protein ACRDMK_02880 [Gaiellaceae bacterium]